MKLPRSLAALLCLLPAVAQAGASLPPGLQSGGTGNVSGMSVTVEGGASLLQLSKIRTGWITLEDINPTACSGGDDTAAFTAAAATGRPIMIGPKTCLVTGPLNLGGSSLVISGTPGVSRIKRGAINTGTWIQILATNVAIEGIIFDGNSALTSANTVGVLTTSAVQTATFTRSRFTAFAGAAGTGLIVQGAYNASSSFTADRCEFDSNGNHGLWGFSAPNMTVSRSRAHDNAQTGIRIDPGVGSTTNVAYRPKIIGNAAYNNKVGIVVGSFTQAASTPVLYGNANPAAIYAEIANNDVFENTVGQISASGVYFDIHHNKVSKTSGTIQGSGFDAHVQNSKLHSNILNVPNANYGIDTGGSFQLDIYGNDVTGANVPLNIGGSQQIRFFSNRTKGFAGNAGIIVNAAETDGSGIGFPYFAQDIEIHDNTIVIPSSSQYGLQVLDGALNISVKNNQFVSSASGVSHYNMMQIYASSVEVSGNKYNGTTRYNISQGTAGTNGLYPVTPNFIWVMPDGADEVFSNVAGGMTLGNAMTRTLNDNLSKVIWITPVNPGSGYTTATVTITDASGQGSGATANAVIYNGGVIGFRMLTRGGSYNAAQTTVSITGDGSGATATPVINPGPQGTREIRALFNQGGLLKNSGSFVSQSNPTGKDIQLPATSWVLLRPNSGTWQVSGYPDRSLVVDAPVPASGSTYTTANGTEAILAAPTGTLASWTVTLPLNPVRGELRIYSSAAITSLTLSPNTGQSVQNAPTTLAANGSIRLLYNPATLKWVAF